MEKDGQIGLNLGHPAMRCVPFDGGTMEQGIKHLPRHLARLVRRKAGFPPEMRPDIDGEPLLVQIASLWAAHQRFAMETKRKDDPRLQERFLRVARVYSDLALAGARLQRADAFKERHAKLLLHYWRTHGKTVGTIRKNWSLLSIWSRVLGKPGMLGRLEAYWPDIPDLVRQQVPAQDATALARGPSPGQMLELMRATDRTHWFVERLCTELGLTVEEALLFDRDTATGYLAGRLVVRATQRREVRSVALDQHSKVVLVQEVEAHIHRLGRRRLMWPDMGVPEAVKKHQNRLAYMRRKYPHDLPSGGEHEA